MIAEPKNLLGVGLYTPAEAALYARVAPPLISRWVFGSKSGEPIFLARFAQEKLVSFHEFVQALAIRATRLPPYNVPLRKIRQALDIAKNEYGVEYPFAMEHKTYLFGGNIEIKLSDDRFVEVSGPNRRNLMMKPVIELYMQDLTYKDGLAADYKAFEWREHTILMDPEVRFGEPIIKSCGYTARALWEAFEAEGSREAAAEVYGVSVEDIDAACRYFDHLQGNASGR